MRSSAAVLSLVAALALGACGQASSVSNFKGEEAKVAQVVEDLEADGNRTQADDICSGLLTKALQEKVAAPGASCAAEMKKALEDADTFALTVDDVTVSGTTATARVSGKDDNDRKIVRTFGFTKDGASWRIESFGTG
jgi:outer membrane lipoprotein-sorting protein